MSEVMTLALPHTAADVATLQRAAETEVAEYVEFTIETPEEFAAVDAALTDVVHRLDAVAAMQKSALAPLGALESVIRGWFRPVIEALQKTQTRYKGTMGAYELERRKREREARDAAAQAASTGGDIVGPLTTASALAERTGRATARVVWKVERIVRDLLPAEYLTPDEKKIAAVARAHAGDDPPVIPGVVFRQDVQIGARR